MPTNNEASQTERAQEDRMIDDVFSLQVSGEMKTSLGKIFKLMVLAGVIWSQALPRIM